MINAIALIQLEWNAWNGFIFNFVQIELGKKEARSLLSINTSSSFLIIDIMFFQFTIFDKTDNY